MIAEDFQLGLVAGQAHGDGEEEAVELGLRERKSTRRGGVVLSSNDEKGIGKLPRDAVDGDLAFIHCFQQRRLRAGRGAIDFVGEKEVGKDRSGNEIEVATLLAVEIVAENVRGEEIGRELHPPETAAKRGGESMGQGGFSDSRRTGDEGVPAGKERSEKKINRVFRTKDCGEKLFA